MAKVTKGGASAKSTNVEVKTISEAPAGATLKIKSEYAVEGKARTTLLLVQGDQPRGAEFTPRRTVQFPIDTLPQDIKDLCTIYGLRAFLADKTSDAKKNGVDKFDWMVEVYNALLKGEWFTKRAAKASGAIEPEVIELVAELSGGGYAEVAEQIKAAGKEWLDAFKAKYADDLADRRTKKLETKADALSGLL